MPIPKCKPTEVYHKASKSCIEVGGEKYKNIVNKDPSAFSYYAKKIEKILKNKKPSVCKDNQVYSKLTKRCIKINSQGFKAALKKDPNVFSNQLNKIKTFQVKSKTLTKTPPKPKTVTPPKPRSVNKNNVPLAKVYPNLYKPKTVTPPKPKTVTPPKPKTVKCPSNKVYSKYTRRCILIGGQTYKSILKKNPDAFNDQKEIINKMKPKSKTVSPKKTNVSMENKLLEPVVENKVPDAKKNNMIKSVKLLEKIQVSNKTKQLFMSKAYKILRGKNSKQEEISKHYQSNPGNIGKEVFIKKPISIHLEYLQYFSPNIDRDTSIFMPKGYRIPKIKMIINYPRDNVFEYFYKYILKQNLNPDIIDTKWYLKSQKYISNLTDRQRYALFAYTKNGDVYLNIKERGLELDYNRVIVAPLFYEFMVYMSDPGKTRDIFKKDISLLEDEAYLIKQSATKYRVAIENKKDLFDFYVKFKRISGIRLKNEVIDILLKNLGNTISSVIKKAPPTTKPMVLYRGVKNSFFTANKYDKVHKKDEVYYNKGFVSTSFSYRTAINTFTNDLKGCCFKVITVLPGTRCIPLLGLTYFPSEAEVLFDRDTKFIVRDKYTAKIPRTSKESYLNKPSTISMKIADIIIG